jgi:hypothetical protein
LNEARRERDEVRRKNGDLEDSLAYWKGEIRRAEEVLKASGITESLLDMGIGRLVERLRQTGSERDAALAALGKPTSARGNSCFVLSADKAKELEAHLAIIKPHCEASSAYPELVTGDMQIARAVYFILQSISIATPKSDD